MSHKVLAYDLGGTKIAAAVVDKNGKILAQIKQPALFWEGKKAVLDQLTQIGQTFLGQFSDIKTIGLASAGPLDPSRGILLNPTNFKTKNGPWGTVKIADQLQKALKKKVILENDAAAAVLAEHWLGAGKKYKNIMILTLGTGLGTGLYLNGSLCRSGRGLHPEAGHIIINCNETKWECGCSNLGCAEVYLSGNGFTKWANFELKTQNQEAIVIAQKARDGQKAYKKVFDRYAEYMAVAMTSYTALYSPEIIVLTGSFAATADLFLPQVKQKLVTKLKQRRYGIDLLPKLCLSKLDNHAGVLGAAYLAFLHQKTL